MITINKEERAAIHAKFPHIHIVRTMIHDSNRHHYYCTEDRRVLQFLKRYRNRNVIEHHE